MRRKLFFFDADGTLVPNDAQHSPSPAVCAALAALRRAGHKTFLCPGRTLCGIGPALLSAGFDGVVAGAGAYIRLDGECIYHHVIPTTLLRATVEAILRCRVSCLLEGTYHFYYAGQGSRRLPWDFPRIACAADVTGNESVEKFTAHVSEPGEFEPLRAFLAPRYEIYGTDSGMFFEMALKGQDKASAIRRLCARCGVPPEDTVAFGDSRNDLAMLRAAGMGVAMGNAPADVRAAARLVTGTVEEEGVPAALRQLALIE